VAKTVELATEMMRPDAGLHADQARRQVGKAGLHLATRPFLTQHNGPMLIVAYDVKRVLADIDANHGDCSVECLGHGVLLGVGAPSQRLSLVGARSTAGPFHYATSVSPSCSVTKLVSSPIKALV
jgi:hypothetical protein